MIDGLIWVCAEAEDTVGAVRSVERGEFQMDSLLAYECLFTLGRLARCMRDERVIDLEREIRTICEKYREQIEDLVEPEIRRAAEWTEIAADFIETAEAIFDQHQETVEVQKELARRAVELTIEFDNLQLVDWAYREIFGKSHPRLFFSADCARRFFRANKEHFLDAREWAQAVVYRSDKELRKKDPALNSTLIELKLLAYWAYWED
ncbi:MAG: hypothetical protein KatS3mg087_1342 [Patescibacteria group bacterium]|nr:MAG: hypothetical protein KatS3mg087_1342 [Patescibacteria group bacterium]